MDGCVLRHGGLHWTGVVRCRSRGSLGYSDCRARLGFVAAWRLAACETFWLPTRAWGTLHLGDLGSDADLGDLRQRLANSSEISFEDSSVGDLSRLIRREVLGLFTLFNREGNRSWVKCRGFLLFVILQQTC